MNRDRQLLRETIETLREIRSETHSRGDDSAVQKLDEIISYLETELAKSRQSLTADNVLKLLGEIVKVLPFISKLIDMLAK